MHYQVGQRFIHLIGCHQTMSQVISDIYARQAAPTAMAQLNAATIGHTRRVNSKPMNASNTESVKSQRAHVALAEMLHSYCRGQPCGQRSVRRLP